MTETIRDQNVVDKSAKLFLRALFPNENLHRWNVEASEKGIYYCNGFHEKYEPCEETPIPIMGVSVGQKYRHLKRGSTYTVIGIATIRQDPAGEFRDEQGLFIYWGSDGVMKACSPWAFHANETVMLHKNMATLHLHPANLQSNNPPLLREGSVLVVYKAEDETWWAREISEFLDGRFELVNGAVNSDVRLAYNKLVRENSTGFAAYFEVADCVEYPDPVFEKMTAVVKHAHGHDPEVDGDLNSACENAVARILNLAEGYKATVASEAPVPQEWVDKAQNLAHETYDTLMGLDKDLYHAVEQGLDYLADPETLRGSEQDPTVEGLLRAADITGLSTTLAESLRRAAETYKAMSPEDRKAMWKAQRDSWCKGPFGPTDNMGTQIVRDDESVRTWSDLEGQYQSDSYVIPNASLAQTITIKRTQADLAEDIRAAIKSYMTAGQVPTSEFDPDFIIKMIQASMVSYFKYGLVAKAYGPPHRMIALDDVRVRSRRYRETGNLNFLVDAANFVMFEAMFPTSKYNPQWTEDSASQSPGRTSSDGRKLVQEDNDGGRIIGETILRDSE